MKWHIVFEANESRYTAEVCANTELGASERLRVLLDLQEGQSIRIVDVYNVDERIPEVYWGPVQS